LGEAELELGGVEDDRDLVGHPGEDPAQPVPGPLDQLEDGDRVVEVGVLVASREVR
jgi:hypothetical protein